MEKENIVRTIELVGTALALTLTIGIIVPAQDASANNDAPRTHDMQRQPAMMDVYTVTL